MWTDGIVSEPKIINEKFDVEREGKEESAGEQVDRNGEGKEDGSGNAEGKVGSLSARSGKSKSSIGTPNDRTFLVSFDSFLEFFLRKK